VSRSQIDAWSSSDMRSKSMPIQLDRYPLDWKAISLRIRERDGWRCKWCGVPNGKWILRNEDGTIKTQFDCCEEIKDGSHEWLAWNEDNEGNLTSEMECFSNKEHPTRIVLTVAHLGTPHEDGTPGDKHNKMDVRDENLAALCQKCHLAYDMDEHIANRRVTLARKKHTAIVASGQLAIDL
jgi:hypothetical protein